MTGNGRVEVAAIDPVAPMQAIDNPRLKDAALQVSEKLKRVIARLRDRGEQGPRLSTHARRHRAQSSSTRRTCGKFLTLEIH